MSNPRPESSLRRSDSRPVLRYVGSLVVFAGVVLTAIGAFSLFSSWNSVGASRYFWSAFLGIPLITLGSLIAQFSDPERFRQNVAGGLSPGKRPSPNTSQEHRSTQPALACRRCEAANPATAKFCDQCGMALEQTRCQTCGAAVASNARFCNECGNAVE